MRKNISILLTLHKMLLAAIRKIKIKATTIKYRIILPSVGDKSIFQWNIRFTNPSIVSIGSNCYFWYGLGCSADYPGEPLVIGNRVQINRNVHLDTTGGLTINDDTLISEEVVIFTHDHGLNPHSPAIGIPKIIESGVWIGMRSVIMPSCKRIGKNAVIGAGSIVTKDVPENAIVAGNPAKVIRFREDSSD